MKPSYPQGKPIPTPWIMRLLLVIMGPCLFIFTLGMILWLHLSVREIGKAQVVEVINQYDAKVVSGQNDFCPVFEWTFAGKKYHEVSQFCGNMGDFSVGQKVEIRFDPTNPKKVVPNTLWATYGFAVILLPWSIIISIPVVGMIFKKKKPVGRQ